MNEPIVMDAEYESIRTVFKSRGSGANQLPCKVVTYIPAERADAILELDERIQKLQKIAPFIIGGATILVSFIAGTMT